MTATKSALANARVLLLQARTADDPAKVEEVQSFARASGLDVGQFTSHDLLNGPPSLRQLDNYDATMIGGSGDFYVSKRDLPQHDAIVDFLGQLSNTDHPTFASCFGFQYLVAALGGNIIYDPERTELGTHLLHLTEAGRQDELLGQLPPEFMAQMGHKDRAETHLPGIPTLASSQIVGVQAIRIPGKPIWATQFHPELDKATNLGRYWRYLDGYTAVMSDEERDAAVNSFHESPDTWGVLRKFLALVLG